MDYRAGFAAALRMVRRTKGMTQEDFGLVSSRTYVSSLERAEKSPTLEKVEDLAGALGVHPLTLLILAFSGTRNDKNSRDVLQGVLNEVEELRSR